MFLFFSKLVPQLFYPLGFACLLLLAALLLVWKFPRWAAAAIALAWICLMTAGNGWVADAIVVSIERRALALRTETTGNLPAGQFPKADAIVVLGGGTKPAAPPRPWVDLADEGDRVLYGVKLYREGFAPKLILSGGRIGWMNGGPPESEDMAELASAMGVPMEDLLQDPSSLNTRENAENVRAILQREGLGRILLVTSAMHMPRSMAIFRKLGMAAIAAPTDFLVTDRDQIDSFATWEAIALNLLPDADRLRQTTRALKEYFGTFIYWLRGWV